MGEALLYLLVAAFFVFVQVVAGGQKKKKKGSGPKQVQTRKVVPLSKPEEKTAEESARVFMKAPEEETFDDPCDSEDAPRIHLHQVDEQTMEQAGEENATGFVVRSIRRINNAPAWNRAGREEQVYSRM